MHVEQSGCSAKGAAVAALTVADIERWDAGDVREVFHAATSRAQASFNAANGMATLPAPSERPARISTRTATRQWRWRTLPAASLTSLPTLEDTRAQLESTIERVGQQISAIVPAVTWAWRREASGRGCHPPYEQSDGQEIPLANFVSDVPIPEQNWTQAYDIAHWAGTAIGAPNVTVFKDAPDDHDVQSSSDTGTTLRLGSQVAAVLTGSTGCRLPADKH